MIPGAVALCNLSLHMVNIFHTRSDLLWDESIILGTGFGYDSLACNYKVVRIWKTMKAEVFTPGTSDSWREIRLFYRLRATWEVRWSCILQGKLFLVAVWG